MELLVAAYEMSLACLPRWAPRTWCDQPLWPCLVIIPPTEDVDGGDESVLVVFTDW